MKPKNKILYLQKYSMDSVTVRSGLYRDIYKKRGYKVVYRSWDKLGWFNVIEKICPPFLMYFANKFFSLVLRIYRFWIIYFDVKHYDGIVIMKYFPASTVKKIRSHAKGKILYDFDDAIWMDKYNVSNCSETLQTVDCISVDNRYLADYARVYNPNVFVFPPPAQFESLGDKEKNYEHEEITIGWIGSPGTSFYLYILHDVLEKLGKRYKNIKLLILGYPFTVLHFFENIKYEVIGSYDAKIMNEARCKIDIGLFPLIPCVDSMGRGLCKPVMYMGAAIPVVATNYGLVDGLIKDGENGFLCNNEQEWFDKISLLIESAALRKEIGQKGFKTVEEFSLEKNFDLLENNFLSHL